MEQEGVSSHDRVSRRAGCNLASGGGQQQGEERNHPITAQMHSTAPVEPSNSSAGRQRLRLTRRGRSQLSTLAMGSLAAKS